MDEDRSTIVLALVAAGILVILVGALLVLRRAGSHPALSAPALNAEEKAYLSQIAVTDARMSAAQNFLGDTVTCLDAKVTNKGGRTVRRVVLELTFADTLNQVVLRETARPVTPATPPLKPGATRSFQVSFDRMPQEWNQGPPTITPVNVNF